MIRFLILCTFFFLLYLVFSGIGEFDSNVSFSVYDYKIETTLFTLGAFFIATQLALMVILKLIFLIFDIPSMIKKEWHRRKLIKVNKKLLDVLAELLMGNRKRFLTLSNNMINEIEDNKEIISLVMAEAEQSFDKKIQHYSNLIDKKHYSVYASKKLAEIFYKNTHHKQAEECAVRAFNEDDTDTELMLILIRIYASLGEWPKLVFMVSKLQKSNAKMLEKNTKEIARYYYAAAKSYLQNGSDDEALKFLEYALELNPVYIEALNLFTELSTNTNNTAAILKILRAAFSAKPSFEVARMYVDSATGSAEAIYGVLAGIVQPAKYPALFLALAAYLGLIEKINELKGPKLISYEKEA